MILRTHRANATFTTEEKARAAATKEASKSARQGYPCYSLAVIEITFEKSMSIAGFYLDSSYNGQVDFTSTELRYTYELTLAYVDED